jgi:hypothetical protein
MSFATPPFGAVTSTNPAYFRVFATIFYKYKAGDTVTIIDNSISTKINTYTKVFTQPLNWRYGTAPIYSVNVTPNASVTNPTYVVTPGNQSFSSPTITVSTIGAKSYTVTQYGTYPMIGKAVVYTLSATTDTNIPTSSGYSIELNPGAITKTTTATAPSVTFAVTPTVATVYTITQSSGSSTLTNDTFISVGASTYVLNPGNISQSSNSFAVSIPPSSNANSFTITGVSSNTVIGANTTTVINSFPAKSVHNLGTAVVPFAANNPVIKIPSFMGARLAVALRNQAVTGSADAVLVSKNPLALNDALNLVRVSQNGARTDDANGNPTNSTIAVIGRPILLEWSKSGTELYYATDSSRVYRVSHITEINDLSPGSDNGKFFTDIFSYNQSSPHTPNSATLNPVSPYRTTLIGRFDAPVSGITVGNGDTTMVLTFNKTASTGTTGAVMYANNNVKKKSFPSVNWASKAGSLPTQEAYCSLIEKDNNKQVFIGTNDGLYYTNDISASSVSWNYANASLSSNSDSLPRVQIFDIKQQTMMPWDCYNSGQIYIATNGRGVWTNDKFMKPYFVSVSEFEEKVSKGNNLSLYPNPTNGNVNIVFDGISGENAMVQVMDLSGRVVKTEMLGKLEEGEVVYTVETSSINSGVYLVNVTSDAGIKRIAKLIVSK